MKKKKIIALALCGMMLFGLAGCKKDDTGPDADPTETAAPAESAAPEKPEDFVDNSAGLDEIDEKYLFESDPDAGITLGKRDQAVYYAGMPMGLMFATNLITADPEGDASNGFPLARIWDRIDYIRLGSNQYGITDLVKPMDEGFQVLEMLASDFGVIKYTQDANGLLVSAENLGTLSGEALREAYSERDDRSDYTVCVYYLDARMNGMDADDYDKCRETLKETVGVETDQYLDGTLAVMLYYDTEGYDLFYNIAIIAPSYWDSVEDFENNMDARVRHDITNCHMMIDGDKPVGFVNQVFIRCDHMEIPSGTYIPDDKNNSRIEDGAIGDNEKSSNTDTKNAAPEAQSKESKNEEG